MINLERLTDNLFSDTRLSNSNLRLFAEDVLVRTTIPSNNPGGIYNLVITDVQAAYNDYFGSIQNESVKTSIREGLTQTMNEALANLKVEISNLEGLVKFRFANNTAVYQQFYPQGVTYYTYATLAELPGRLAVLQSAATTHLTGADAPAVASLNSRITAWENARTAQLTAIGETENLQTERRTDRGILEIALTKLMLTVAINNINNPDNFNNYYNPAYLPQSDTEKSISGIITANHLLTLTTEGVITSGSRLVLQNKGTTELIFSLNDVPGVLNPVHQVNLQQGNTVVLDGDLPAFEVYYLMVQNPRTDNGRYRVTIG